MHDRRIDGVAHIFGNRGLLFMNAMTWWDHETESIWSQPWGAAIDGPSLGTTLKVLPFQLVTFDSWVAEHPETRVLIDERADLQFVGQIPIDRFVIGVVFGQEATGFYFGSAAQQGVVNDTVGEFPIAVFADAESRGIDVYLRRLAGDLPGGAPEAVTFQLTAEGEVIDVETGSLWNIDLGVATAGPLRGTVLQRAPFISSFDWAWEDFYPSAEFWGDIDDLSGGLNGSIG